MSAIIAPPSVLDLVHQLTTKSALNPFNPEELDLSHSNWTEASLPKLDDLWPSVKTLNLESNYIEIWQAETISKWHNLTSLNLSYNNLQPELIRSLAQLTSLKTLKLNFLNYNQNNNQVFIQAQQSIISILPKLPKLTELGVARLRIRNNALISMAPYLKNIETLNLRLNNFDAAQPFGYFQKIKKLDLSLLNLNDEDIKKISHALAIRATLTELDLSYNKVTEDSLIYLTHIYTLQTLNLAQNPVTIFGSELDIYPKTVLTQLHKLYLDRCDDLYLISFYFKEFLHQATNLVDISIGFNNPNNLEAIKELLDWVRTNNQLKSLHLPCLSQLEPLPDDFILAICNMLKENKSLEHLNLTNNDLKDQSINIMSALKHNNSLTSLNLCGNKIDDRHLSFLLQAYNENPEFNIQELNLFDNKVHEQGVDYLCEILTLKEINLRANPAFLPENHKLMTLPKIESLTIDYVNHDSDSVSQFMTQAEQCNSLKSLTFFTRMIPTIELRMPSILARNPNIEQVRYYGFGNKLHSLSSLLLNKNKHLKAIKIYRSNLEKWMDIGIILLQAQHIESPNNFKHMCLALINNILIFIKPKHTDENDALTWLSATNQRLLEHALITLQTGEPS